MVKMNGSKCVDSSQIAVILKRIEVIKSNATIEKKEGNEHGLSGIVESVKRTDA